VRREQVVQVDRRHGLGSEQADQDDPDGRRHPLVACRPAAKDPADEAQPAVM
jgi:hypothetical protein